MLDTESCKFRIYFIVIVLQVVIILVVVYDSITTFLQQKKLPQHCVAYAAFYCHVTVMCPKVSTELIMVLVALAGDDSGARFFVMMLVTMWMVLVYLASKFAVRRFAPSCHYWPMLLFPAQFMVRPVE